MITITQETDQVVEFVNAANELTFTATSHEHGDEWTIVRPDTGQSWGRAERRGSTWYAVPSTLRDSQITSYSMESRNDAFDYVTNTPR